MIERVRAILITPAMTMLVIKRTKPGIPPYWVLPGGHADEADRSLEDALCREVREELGGDATIVGLVNVLERETERQYFYLARISQWSFADRTGPEFSEAGRGSYELEEIPATAKAVASLDLKPREIAAVITGALRDGRLFALPDLRGTGLIR